MKVIIVGPAWPLRGGIANFNEALCKALINEGIDASIVSFSLQYPSILFPGKTQFDDGEAPSGVPIVTKINSINPINWIKVSNYILNQKPDLVIIRFWLPFMGPSLGTIAKRIRKKVPVIAITDNVIPHEKRTGDKSFTRYFVNNCDGFITLSRSVLQDLGLFDQNKPKVFLPHPIYNIFGDKISKDEAIRKLNLDPSFHYILFFGIIRKYKGLDILLEAFAQFDHQKYKVKLIVAGEFYEDEKPYREIVTKNKIEDYIIWKNHFIPSDDVKHYFCASDLVAQTYRTATQSGVTQIAYHFGIPMLVTDVGGLGETVKHGVSGYVEPVVPEKIAEALTDFYQNNREVEMKSGVEQEKEKFEWPYFVKGLMDLYEKIRA